MPELANEEAGTEALPEDIRPCETCGRTRPLYVYALPGVPMSVGNCGECLSRGAYPLYIAEGMAEVNGGLDRCAEWVRESLTWKDGGYMTIEEAMK